MLFFVIFIIIIIFFIELRMAFDAFDPDKSGKIPSDMLGTILGMMGKQQDSRALAALLGEIEPTSELTESDQKQIIN